MTPISLFRRRLLPLLLATAVALGLVPAAASAAEPPDPLDRGPYTVERLDPFKAGLATLHEPASGGTAAEGSNASITLQIRGVTYGPESYPGKSPLIVLVHGNHTQCDKGTSPDCEVFKRNDEGYAYLGENLASWGYRVVSLDQDQMMSRQDGAFGKGMHARRLLIMALLDALYKANEEALPTTADYNLPASLVNSIDFTRIGLMGHSRGGDAVSSFIEYDRMRPTGRRYPLRGVISLAPVDYERHAPYGMPYMTIFGTCDGDVSNLQGARLYERSQYIETDPYPRIQSAQVGANHNWYNSVWKADGDDSTSTDAACSPPADSEAADATTLRLTGQAGPGASESYGYGGTNVPPETADKLDPAINTRISGDPARMGDQEKIGLATMSAFFRRYVGGEGAFEPYLTGQRASEGKTELPASACPTSPSGTRISCADRVANSFFAPPGERLDLIRPDTEHPLSLSALGTSLSATGFSNPYLKNGGITPRPETTGQGIDWCDPEPYQTEPGQLGEGGYPDAAKPCPIPRSSEVGGQKETREHVPVNQSYGRQLSLAWEGPATLSTKIPATDADVSGYKALSLAAAVNFFDPRNPARSTSDPEVGRQHFAITLTDGEGHTATVDAGSPEYGTALEQSVGSISARVHVILRDIRVPLSDLAAQGIDLTDVTKLELSFGGAGMPASGSIQLADVRFQEAVGGTDVLLDSTAPDAGPGEGPPSSGPDPAAELEGFDREPSEVELPDVTLNPGANVWTVDDDGVQCPNAKFTRIQSAINYASPWDTIVICPGEYEEGSTPVSSAANPVQSGAQNGLTITKPLKIKGAGASLVKIRPVAVTSLLGSQPYLRDGGGNVVTISRQSLGSSDYDENFVDISGVTIEAPSTYVDAGVAFFNTSGRISNSVVGPFRTSTSSTTQPHGWGIIATNSLIGSGAGTIERQVTVDHTLVKGYKSGGILFDDATGKDSETTPVTTPSGIKEYGYVTNTTVEGLGATTSFPQVGIQYHAGATGFVEDSKVTGNLFTTTPRKSAGILLTGAETGSWYAAGSVLSGNGYGLFNADVANTTVREQAPALAIGNFWGTGGDPIEGPSEVALGKEGVSELDGSSDPSVEFSPVLGSAPTIASVPATLPDEVPSGEIVDPGSGETVEVGKTIEPVVLAEDDFGVKSVALTADGTPVASESESPYTFAWAPSAADADKTVTLEATITDSSGQVTTSTVSVPVKAAAKPPVTTPVEATPPSEGKPAKPGKVIRNKKKGTARLVVTVPGPGKLVVYGPGIKKVTGHVTTAGNVQVLLKAKGKVLKTLRKKGKVTVKVTLAFTADGKTVTKTAKVVLVKKK